MISLILCVVLAWSFYIGYSRGLILQAYYVFAAILSLILASGFYKDLAKVFYLWVPFANATEGASTFYFDSKYLFDLDKVFYAGLAFLLIYTLIYWGMRLLGILMHLFQFATPDRPLFNVISGFLSVLVTVVSLQMGLTVLSAVPIATVQNLLHDSGVANALIRYVPFTSSLLKQLWLTNILG